MLGQFGYGSGDRKSTRLNSSHTEIYTLSLHDALPILFFDTIYCLYHLEGLTYNILGMKCTSHVGSIWIWLRRSEEHTSELQSHRDLHSFPTRRSSDLIF